MITLVIVGVVAALTIPNLIAKYQKEQTAAQLKKAYSTLSNALLLARNDYGDSSKWDWDSSAFWSNSDAAEAWAEKYLYPYIKGQKITKKNVFYVQCIEAIGDYCKRSGRYDYPFYFLDGTALEVMYGGYSWSSDPWVIIRVDLNGMKKPNVYGKDIFNFYYLGKKGFSSAGWVSSIGSNYNNNKRDFIISHCKTIGGVYSSFCADLIMNNGWKIPDDYPW